MNRQSVCLLSLLFLSFSVRFVTSTENEENQQNYETELDTHIELNYDISPSWLIYGNEVTATCTAKLPLISSSVDLVWAIKVDGWYVPLLAKNLNAEELKASVSLTILDRVAWVAPSRKTVMEEPPGVNITSSLKLKAEEVLDNTTVCCAKFNMSDWDETRYEYFNKAPIPRAARKTLRVFFPAHQPTCSVDYHVFPVTVFNQMPLHAVCQASVGSEGNLIWRLTDSPDPDVNSQEWRIDSNGVVEGEVPGNLGVDSEESWNFTTTLVDIMPQDGPYIQSEIEINVSWRLEGAVLRCLTKQHPGFVELKNLTDPYLQSSSLPFKVQYFPQKPSLTTEYRGGNVVFGMCKALVGTDGIVTWALVTNQSSEVWTVDTLGVPTKLDKDQDARLFDVSGELEADKKQGPCISSSVKVRTSSLSGLTYLACFSYNAAATADLMDEQDPLMVSKVITATDSKATNVEGANQAGWVLAPGIAFISLFAVIFTVSLSRRGGKIDLRLPQEGDIL